MNPEIIFSALLNNGFPFLYPLLSGQFFPPPFGPGVKGKIDFNSALN